MSLFAVCTTQLIAFYITFIIISSWQLWWFAVQLCAIVHVLSSCPFCLLHSVKYYPILVDILHVERIVFAETMRQEQWQGRISKTNCACALINCNYYFMHYFIEMDCWTRNSQQLNNETMIVSYVAWSCSYTWALSNPLLVFQCHYNKY